MQFDPVITKQNWASITLPCFYILMKNSQMEFPFSSQYWGPDQMYKLKLSSIDELLQSKLILPLDVNLLNISRYARDVLGSDMLEDWQRSVLAKIYKVKEIQLSDISLDRLWMTLMTGHRCDMDIENLDQAMAYICQQKFEVPDKLPLFLPHSELVKLLFMTVEQQESYLAKTYGIAKAEYYDPIKYLIHNDYTDYRYSDDITDPIYQIKETLLCEYYDIHPDDIINRRGFMTLVNNKIHGENFYIGDDLMLSYGKRADRRNVSWVELIKQLEQAGLDKSQVAYGLDSLNMLFYASFRYDSMEIIQFRQAYIWYGLCLICPASVLNNLKVSDDIYAHVMLLLEGQVNAVEDRFYDAQQLQTCFNMVIFPLPGYTFGQCVNLYISGADDSRFMYEILKCNLLAYQQIGNNKWTMMNKV